MYLSIGPGGAPPPNFAIGPLTAERSASGKSLVVAKVRNTGRGTLDIDGNLTLSKGPGGLHAGPFPAKLTKPLAPGDSARVAVRLSKRLPRGPWRARMRLRSGPIQRLAVATITFPRLAVAAKPPAAKDAADHRHAIVVILVLLLALAALSLKHLGRLFRERGPFARPGVGRR
jgi:hypothetical protein